MNTQEILTLIAAIGAPLSGILVAFISNARSKKQLTAESSVQRAAVKVDEKDAHTREIAVILDGYTAVNAALNKNLERAEAASADCSKKYDALEARFEEADHRAQIQRLEMVDHIRALEALIPNPPGPPERPAWGM